MDWFAMIQLTEHELVKNGHVDLSQKMEEWYEAMDLHSESVPMADCEMMGTGIIQ